MCLFSFLFLSTHSGGTDFLCSVFIISPFLKQKPKYLDKWESLINRPSDIRVQNYESHCILIVHFSWSHHHHNSISSCIKGYMITPNTTLVQRTLLWNQDGSIIHANKKGWEMQKELQKTAVLSGNTIITLYCSDGLSGQPKFYSSKDRLSLPDVKTICKYFFFPLRRSTNMITGFRLIQSSFSIPLKGNQAVQFLNLTQYLIKRSTSV